MPFWGWGNILIIRKLTTFDFETSILFLGKSREDLGTYKSPFLPSKPGI